MSVWTPPARALPAARPPIPAREGISPRKVILSHCVPESPEYWAGLAGDSPFVAGEKLLPGTPLAKPVPAWYHPHVPPEKPIPFDYRVLYQDRNILVVDKPHFLPTTSNGRLVRETLQTRLRVDFGEDDIVPLHRLDRLTAGVVVCSRNRDTRGAYQQLFSRREVTKIYTAHTTQPLNFGPQLVELNMHKVLGKRQVEVAKDGKPTATWVRIRGHVATLRPLSGHTHQLRVLLNHLGAPIVGDDTYPQDLGLDLYNFDHPLQLVAKHVEFLDPLTRKRQRFSSSHLLSGRL